MKPIYSLCICNYNMNDTLESSINSLLSQINDRTEIIVIDDGSSDNSVETLKKIKYKNKSNFNFIALLRDPRRKLGETRNLSIKAAKGKYVILHLDTDDIWEPYINSFIKIYHELEKRLNIEDFFLSGNQIQMSTKDLMISNPYENVYYGEDRLLWSKLATFGKLTTLEHKVFRKRIPIKKRSKKILKVLFSQYSAMSVSFSYSPSIFETLKQYLKRIFLMSDWGYRISFLNFILLFPTIINGILNRQKLYNLSRWDYKEISKINLQDIEKDTELFFGKFNLSKDERSIFFLK